MSARGFRYGIQRTRRQLRRTAIRKLFPNARCMVASSGARIIVTDFPYRWIGIGNTANQAWWDAWCGQHLFSRKYLPYDHDWIVPSPRQTWKPRRT